MFTSITSFLLFNKKVVTRGVKWKELHAVEDEGESRALKGGHIYRTSTTCINKQSLKLRFQHRIVALMKWSTNSQHLYQAGNALVIHDIG